MSNKRIYSDMQQLGHGFISWLQEIVRSTLFRQTEFHIAIPGGSTPEELFRLLAGPLGERLPWGQLHFWWTDERAVSPSDSRSNFRLAEQTLLKPRGVSAAQIHRVKSELDPRKAAMHYGIEIEDTLSRGRNSVPLFDFVLLGVGEDGHVASLFPNAELEEPHPWCVLARHDGLQRISLPFEVISAARYIGFLATGERKASIISRILEPVDIQDEDLPASLMWHRRPDAQWFLDIHAAAQLQKDPIL